MLGPARRLFRWFKTRSTPVLLGARAVGAQHPHTRPEHLKRSPRPLGHASTRQALKELREQYRAFVAAFREAAARWSQGDFSVCFPPFAFPPRVSPARAAQFFDTLSGDLGSWPARNFRRPRAEGLSGKRGLAAPSYLWIPRRGRTQGQRRHLLAGSRLGLVRDPGRSAHHRPESWFVSRDSPGSV